MQNTQTNSYSSASFSSNEIFAYKCNTYKYNTCKYKYEHIYIVLLQLKSFSLRHHWWGGIYHNILKYISYTSYSQYILYILFSFYRNSASSLVGRHRSCGNITVLSSTAFYPFKVISTLNFVF